MNRSELIERVRTAYTADSSTPSEPEALIDFAIRTAFHEILKALKRGEVVTIRDFGRWEVRERAERTVSTSTPAKCAGRRHDKLSSSLWRDRIPWLMSATIHSSSPRNSTAPSTSLAG